MDRVFVEEVVTRSFSHLPPTHYIIKIQSFSSLANDEYEVDDNEDGHYKCSEFEAGRYKWNLVLYPNGNKRKNVKDHISVYLGIANTNSLSFGWEAYAIFCLFLLDQNKDRFLIVQDGMGNAKRFHGLKHEWGFDEFISLEDFNDASNGYLVDDTCVFGAEVFVKERNVAKGECLSMIKNSTSFKHVWKIEKFSYLTNYKDSELFTAANHKWKLGLYPRGDADASGYLSLFLFLTDPNVKIYAGFTMRILDQVQGTRHKTFVNNKGMWFDSPTYGWGSSRLVELSQLKDPGNGLLVNDVCIVEAEVTVFRILKSL
ncbi:Ubiquitin carboxyl-terminal hydrolase 12 [Melia azedarach]|uniref:Ubiquitin carboxyl-terminal hydrolase 12 n=1 Tax=Melia azedarach TaxID=155640 RepID=A0ACC1YIQ6_MELAZ|nr:Ubiquitin carboxyl-terminal hydrolase 12 [Melia azedarach]